MPKKIWLWQYWQVREEWHVNKKTCVKDLLSTNTTLLDLAGRVPEEYVECLNVSSGTLPSCFNQ
jgi:hypothetical protein